LNKSCHCCHLIFYVSYFFRTTIIITTTIRIKSPIPPATIVRAIHFSSQKVEEEDVEVEEVEELSIEDVVVPEEKSQDISARNSPEKVISVLSTKLKMVAQ